MPTNKPELLAVTQINTNTGEYGLCRYVDGHWYLLTWTKRSRSEAIRTMASYALMAGERFERWYQLLDSTEQYARQLRQEEMLGKYQDN